MTEIQPDFAVIAYPSSLVAHKLLREKQLEEVGFRGKTMIYKEWKRAKEAIRQRNSAMSKEELEGEWLAIFGKCCSEAKERVATGEFISTLPNDPFTASAALLELMTESIRKKRTTRKRGPSAAEEFASSSAYLKGTDIKKPFDATISGLMKTDFDNGAKWVLELEDEEKSIVLNQTNGGSLAADLGDDMDCWKGQRIHVFTERRRNPQSNQMVPAVAVCGASEDDPDDLPDDEDDDDDDLE